MKLKDVCKIKHGFAFKGKYIVKAGSTKYVLVTPGNFNIGGGFKSEKCKYFSENGEIPKDYILHEDDLIITMTDLSVKSDTLGYSALVPSDQNYIYLHNQRIGLVYDIDESKVLKKYLYWFMRTKKYHQKVVSSQSGTAIHHTSPNRILDIDIELPSIDVQNKVIKILENIDNKIKLNNKINDNLYELGLNIYSKKAIVEKNKRQLKFFFNVITGKKDANECCEKGLYPFFTCSKQILRINDYSFDSSAILLAGNGDFNIKVYNGKFDAYQRTYVLIPNDKKDLGYLYFAMSDNLQNLTLGFRGSVIKFITKGMIENFRIPLINDINILNTLNIIVDKILANEKENQTLEQLRDTLLPKLMNGEIDLENIEI